MVLYRLVLDEYFASIFCDEETDNEEAFVVYCHDNFLVFLVMSEHNQLVLSVTYGIIKAAENRHISSNNLALVPFEKHALEFRLVLEQVDLGDNILHNCKVRSHAEETAQQVAQLF